MLDFLVAVKIINAVFLMMMSIARARVKQYFQLEKKCLTEISRDVFLSCITGCEILEPTARNRVSYVLLDPDEAQTLL